MEQKREILYSVDWDYKPDYKGPKDRSFEHYVPENEPLNTVYLGIKTYDHGGVSIFYTFDKDVTGESKVEYDARYLRHVESHTYVFPVDLTKLPEETYEVIESFSYAFMLRCHLRRKGLLNEDLKGKINEISERLDRIILYKETIELKE